MLVLNANQEQKQVFHSLVQEIDAQVVWNGRFIIMGDRLILEGLVRSLILHFDIGQAEVKLMELLSEDEEELEFSNSLALEEMISMAVYTFGKWGILKGVQVEQDTTQLEEMFAEILGKYDLDVTFSDESIAFYRAGMRITYEDAAEAVLAAPEVSEPVLKLPPVSQQPEVSEALKNQNSEAMAQRIEKYHARIGVLDRLSDLQKKALLRDIRCDKLLNEEEKEKLYYPIQDYEYQERMHKIEEELKDKTNATYVYIGKLIHRLEKEELFEKTKKDLLAKLNKLRLEYGEKEVRAIMEKVPPHVERAEYKQLMDQLAPYEEIDFAEYKEPLRKMRETLEIKEISNILMQSPKKDRKDYTEILRRMEEQNFAKENAAPYEERILDWISEIDQARLSKLLSNVGTMDFETAASLYEMIRQESFLPKLRANALAMISKRLEEIAMGECRILVNALQKSMTGVINENARHYFYPADKILQKTVKPEETKLIDSAVATYAEKKGMFEYPIFMVDTSKEENGRDGMLLTPEHLFYSTRLSGYRIKVAAVKSVYISTGLLNHKSLIVEEIDGIRHKVPYAVDVEELQNWTKVLGWFLRQLKERPICEKLTYDALQEQNMISCTRCGCNYQDEDVCPECGLHFYPK